MMRGDVFLSKMEAIREVVNGPCKGPRARKTSNPYLTPINVFFWRLRFCICPSHDLLNDSCLGICVVLHVSPLTLSQSPFCICIFFPVNIISSQPISKPQHSVCFRGTLTEHVKVNVCIGPFEKTMLKP